MREGYNLPSPVSDRFDRRVIVLNGLIIFPEVIIGESPINIGSCHIGVQANDFVKILKRLLVPAKVIIGKPRLV